MASYLTATGQYDLKAIMAGARKDSEIARRVVGKGHHPAVVAAHRGAITNEINLLTP